jgi:type I restriction enzyme S subunit
VSDVPNHWVETTLGELNEFVGSTIDPSRFPDERFDLYSVPSFPSGKPEYLCGRDIGSSKQIVSPNDILISKINPRINRVWMVGNTTDKRQIASSEWIVVRSSFHDARYLLHFFAEPNFRDQICSDVTGVGGSLTRAQPKRVATFAVPIPPQPEQKRIADKLDTLLARIDACRDRLGSVDNQASHMTAAVSATKEAKRSASLS